MIAVVARLRVLDGKADEFIEAAKAQVAEVKAHEAGKALLYTLNRSQKDPNLFIFYEQYADADAHAAHGATDHMRAFGGKLRGILDGRPDIDTLELIATTAG